MIKPIRLAPSWDQPTTPFRHSWAGLGNVDQFRWFIRHDMIDQLRLAHEEIGLRHVRAVGMMCDELRTYTIDPRSWRDEHRSPRPNWQIVDRCIEALLSIGVKPMITTCFTPESMASGSATVFSTRSNVTPPKDLSAWTDLVHETIEHLTEQFGGEELRSWYFEVWNEPNLDGFWAGTQSQWFELWKRAFAAIKSVDANYRVGGPSTARGEWLSEAIEYGRKNDCEPDYIITHCYNNDSAHGALSPFDGPQSDRINTSPNFLSGVARGTRKLLEDMDYRGEVHWNEWGRSWFPADDERERANEAAFVVKTMAEVSQEADYFAYWNLSDIYDQVGYGAEEFFGGYGMLSHHALRKPAWQAHQALERLSEERYDLDTSDFPDCSGAIATRGDNAWQVLLYSFKPEDQTDSNLPSPQLLIEPPSGSGEAWVYELSESENEIVAEWEALGSPPYLSRSQLEVLQEKNRFSLSKIDWNASNDSLLSSLPYGGIRLIEFRP